MKKVLIPLIALLVLTVSVNAQDKMGKKGHHHKHQKGMMAKQLNFSDAQKAQAKTINEDSRKKMQEFNKNESITVKEYRDKRFALQQEQKLKMQGLLTSDQKNIIEQKKKLAMAKKEEQHAIKINRLKTKLSLTDEQVNKLNQQREVMKEKIKAVKENDQLDRTAKKEKMMALKTEMKDSRDKLFTPAQIKKIEEMKKTRPVKKAVKK